MDKRIYISNLYDFYNLLLTERQREIFELYYFNDLSLNEIGEKFSITKQGVRDSIVRSEKFLNEYEKKLGLYSKHKKRLDIINEIDLNLKNLEVSQEKIKKLRDYLNRLENID